MIIIDNDYDDVQCVNINGTCNDDKKDRRKVRFNRRLDRRCLIGI